MNEFCQGDVIRIEGFKKQLFVIISKNAFIRATGIFHICPMLPGIPAGPVHIEVKAKRGEAGTIICEQIKAVDPKARRCSRVDLLAYKDIMNVSDAVQGIFEYD
ncbi:MAG: type II toxin-antitoxin system PemK/MazF family toxin [Lachnospiraceae bacterium]|nr:type II toxin-antitoxin system PemK/MazF family toxin [Lachnospiraceae bacterium]